MTNDSNTARDTQRCPGCGAVNDCGIARGEQQCWCMTEPLGLPVPTTETASCYCQGCLQRLSAAANSAQLHKPGIPR